MIPNDREASAQVASIVASARDAGLPTNPIVGKVNYGVNAMRSKPTDIVRAASIVKTRLETAKAALAPNPTEQEITQGADALGASATTETLRELRRTGRNRSVAAALGLLTQLLSSQVPHRVRPRWRRNCCGVKPHRRKSSHSATTLRQTCCVGSESTRRWTSGMHHLIATLAAQRSNATAHGDAAFVGATDPKTTSATPPPPLPRRP